MATSMQQQLHPYYPKTLELPGFAEATMTQSFILATFGSFSVVLVFAVWAFAGTFGRVSKLDKSLMCWFAFSGFIHIVLEGYFAFNANFYTYSVPNFLAEVCMSLLSCTPT
jgi:cholestenol delta-isomerase